MERPRRPGTGPAEFRPSCGHLPVPGTLGLPSPRGCRALVIPVGHSRCGSDLGDHHARQSGRIPLVFSPPSRDQGPTPRGRVQTPLQEEVQNGELTAAADGPEPGSAVTMPPHAHGHPWTHCRVCMAAPTRDTQGMGGQVHRDNDPKVMCTQCQQGPGPSPA